MSESSSTFKELDELLSRLADDRLDADDFRRLRELLAGDEQAYLRYIEVMHLSSSISQWAHEYEGSLEAFVTECITGRETALMASSATLASEHPHPLAGRGDPHPNSANQSAHTPVSMLQWSGPLLVAAALVCLAFLVGRLATAPIEPPDSPLASLESQAARDTQSGERALAGRDRGRVNHATVGRVVRISAHTIWREGAAPTDFLLRLMEGERLDLLSGLAEIELTSGVRLILHERTSFTFSAADRGILHRGSVTGLADDGNYTIITATAEVVDLGTEFGVSVDDDSNTEVVVFEGEVQVAGRGQSAPRNSVHLNEGNAALVDSQGRLAMRVEKSNVRFVRSFPKQATNQTSQDSVSLVDILSGGDGSSGRLSAALDPLTGDTDRRHWTRRSGPGETKSDNKYHRSDYHPMIDGTFIIPADGKDVILDSAGDIGPDFGENDGSSWGPIWARRRTKDFMLQPKGDFWGTGTLPFILDRLADAKDGAIGLHPNVGVTFDLHAADTRLRAKFDSFQAILTNLDNAAILHPQVLKTIPVRTFDFWVFVDGELRASRKNFGRNVEGVPIEVALGPQDRFLTLVSTDGGNSNSYDHVVLIDPVLKIRTD